MRRTEDQTPLRVLVVLPSWVGDVVMATPALRSIRDAWPGAFIGALARPGIDAVLSGGTCIDEFHVDRASGVMGPKHAAAKLRARRYDAAVLLSNSFRTALVTRLAFIPRRVGYDRDGRGLLLTDRIEPRRDRARGGFGVEPAAAYYMRAAKALVDKDTSPVRIEDVGPYELATTDEDERLGDLVLERAGLTGIDTPLAVLNPGGNNPAKRWPADRFGRLAAWLARERGVRVAVNGSPGEREVVDAVVDTARTELRERGDGARVASLAAAGGTIGSLKAVIRRSSLLVTNDTGPRHMALAFGVPTVSLFGPTDPRWTPPPPHCAPERVLASRDGLADDVLSDDEPERCRIEAIGEGDVRSACAEMLRA